MRATPLRWASGDDCAVNIRPHGPAGSHIEVHFTGEDHALVVDVPPAGTPDDVADAIVSALDAAGLDEAEIELQARLDGIGGNATRSP